jgi:hypothetical protein
MPDATINKSDERMGGQARWDLIEHGSLNFLLVKLRA